MNTLIITTKKLFKLTLVSSLLLTVASVYAADPIKVETKSSNIADITNVTTSKHGKSILINGKIKRQSGGHIVIPGMVKIELLDADKNVVKTMTTKHTRHSHHTNKDYKFSARVKVDSDNVSMVRIMHEMDQMH